VLYCCRAGACEEQGKHKKDSFSHTSPPIGLAGADSLPARRERGSAGAYGNPAWREESRS
jgi:hypothetical protein